MRSKYWGLGLLGFACFAQACGSVRDLPATSQPGDGGNAASSGSGGVTGAGGSPGRGGVSSTGGSVSGSSGSAGSGAVSATGGAAGSTGAAGSGATGNGGTSGSGGAAGMNGTAGSAGTAGTNGTSGTAGTDAGIAPDPRIPTPPAECPMLVTGNITVLGQQVRLWVGPSGQRGPLVFYWHGTGSSAAEAVGGLASGVDEVTGGGGVVAAFTTSTTTGEMIGPGTWYTGDFAMADVVAACGVQQGLVNPRRVYTAGCSAGGLTASWMVYARSSYLAAAMVNSGGIYQSHELEAAWHAPAVITAHGPRSELVILDIEQAAKRLTQDVASQGGFAVNCFYDGGMCQSPASVKAAQWQFLKDHPFGVRPSPYADGLPPSFPDYCAIVR